MDAKRSAASAANLLACAVLALLGAVAVRRGLLGLLTLLVCTKFVLDEHAPTWGARAFSAQMMAAKSPEERAAAGSAVGTPGRQPA